MKYKPIIFIMFLLTILSILLCSACHQVGSLISDDEIITEKNEASPTEIEETVTEDETLLPEDEVIPIDNDKVVFSLILEGAGTPKRFDITKGGMYRVFLESETSRFWETEMRESAQSLYDVFNSDFHQNVIDSAELQLSKSELEEILEMADEIYENAEELECFGSTQMVSFFILYRDKAMAFDYYHRDFGVTVATDLLDKLVEYSPFPKSQYLR